MEEQEDTCFDGGDWKGDHSGGEVWKLSGDGGSWRYDGEGRDMPAQSVESAKC